MVTYEFAIKKDILNSGKEILTPVCRNKSKFGRFFPNPWIRITIIYGHVVPMELDFNPDLSYEDCINHIKQYQQALQNKMENQIQTVEFHMLEETQLSNT